MRLEACLKDFLSNLFILFPFISIKIVLRIFTLISMNLDCLVLMIIYLYAIKSTEINVITSASDLQNLSWIDDIRIARVVATNLR